MAHHPTISMTGLFDAEYFDLESAHVKDTFRIFVAKPISLDPTTTYPAIFALDGNAAFASLMGTQRMLTQGGEVPASFVIGIGYPGDTLMEAMANRNRDYAPTDPGEMEARSLGGSVPAGAPAFLDFLQQELKPLLMEKYPVDAESNTLQGMSLGGLFGAWVLLTRPESFQNYILGSPALWWRDEQVWQWEEDYAKQRSDLPATVFIGAGELEDKYHMRAAAVNIAEKNPLLRAHVNGMIEWSDINGWPRMAELTPEFAHRLKLRNYPNLNIHCHNMPDENHMSVSGAITSRGLRFVNGSWQPTPER